MIYTEQYIFYLLVFSFIAYFVITDESIAAAIILGLKILRNNIERLIWMIRFHPLVTTNKIMQWYMMRKYMKEAEKMQKELFKND